MIPSTPGSHLKRDISKSIGDIIGPDYGKTKVIERGGKTVLSGLMVNDPFKGKMCDFNDPECYLGAGCSRTSICTQISRNMFDPKHQRSTPIPTQVVAGARKRRRYIGQSGTSAHKRMRSHRRELRS